MLRCPACGFEATRGYFLDVVVNVGKAGYTVKDLGLRCPSCDIDSPAENYEVVTKPPPEKRSVVGSICKLILILTPILLLIAYFLFR